MATYTISAPDGKTYSITGPEGASQADVQAEVLRQNPTAGTASKAAAPEAPADPLRQTALTGRAAGEGVLGAFSLPDTVQIGTQNLMRRGVNSLFGTHLPMQQSWADKLSNTLTQSGAPVPETENEKTTSALTRGVTGALTGGGLLGAASPALATPTNLVRTGISGATSAGSAEAVRRNGGGPVSQFVASILGGAAPFIGSAIPRQVPQAQPTASANASVSPGVASTETTASGSAQAAGSGGGSTFGTVGADPSAGLTPAQQQLAQWGQQNQFRLTPGQGSGSKALQQMEAKLESQPMTSGPFNTLKSANQQNLNRITASAIGETANAVDSTVLGRASERLGNVFENARSPNRITITDPAATSRAIDTIDQDVRGLLPGNGSVRDNALVQDLERMTREGGVNGQQLGALSSKLGRAAFKQMTGPAGDRDWGQALYQVKDHVDDMIQQSLAPAEAATYGQARQQYRNLMLLTDRIGTINPSTGNVSGAALANRLQQADKSGFLFGRNQSDWYNAARFSQAFKPVVGDSGTATRSMLHSPTDFLLSLPFNLATRAYLRTPAAAASAVAGAPHAFVNSGAGTRGLLNPLLIPGATGGLLSENAP